MIPVVKALEDYQVYRISPDATNRLAIVFDRASANVSLTVWWQRTRYYLFAIISLPSTRLKERRYYLKTKLEKIAEISVCSLLPKKTKLMVGLLAWLRC